METKVIIKQQIMRELSEHENTWWSALELGNLLCVDVSRITQALSELRKSKQVLSRSNYWCKLY